MIFMRLHHVAYGEKAYFCGQELVLHMDAYFRICVIFATRVRKLLIEITD